MSLPVPEEGWARLSPLTPLLRGGRFLLVLLLLVGQQGLRSPDARVLGVVFGVVLPVGVLAGYVGWRTTRYRLTATELQVDSGVLTRRARRVPLARLQAVDVVRPLVARVLGLAELRLEVAGGGGAAEAPLQYLPEEQAQALRTRLLDLAAGRAADAPRPEPDEVLVVVPTRPLVVSTLLGAPLLLLLASVVVTGALAVVDPRLVVPAVLGGLPLVLTVGSVAVRRVLSEYGFTVAESADGLRLQHGLLDTRTQTIPDGRVQLVRVKEPLLWRRFDWVRVEVDVAGYGGGREEQAATGALLPVAPRPLAEALVARVLGGPLPVADVPAPGRARLRAPLSWPRLAYGVDDVHLVATRGVLTTTTDVVPLAKVQSVRSTDGPLQRRLGLATVRVDTAGRRLPGAVVPHRDAREARRLLGELAARARAARAAR